MLTVLFINDPFSPFARDAYRLHVEANNVRALMEQVQPGFIEFDHPTLCLVNGAPFMRAQWKDELRDGDTITFVRLAQGITEIIIAVVVIIVAVVVTLLFHPKANPAAIGADDKTQQNGDPVYQLSGQKNQNKLNNAVECAYGYNRIYPAYAATPYNVYRGNDQYQFSLFCLGNGSFDILQSFLENTPVTSFQNVDLAFYPPGSIPTLVHAAVFTSADVSDIELYAPNETSYKEPPVAFVCCEPGDQINRIECDVSFPSGLYKTSPPDMDGTTHLEDVTVKALFEYQAISNDGTPIGSWTTLFELDETHHTITPIRYTRGADVGAGRYQVRARRTNTKDTTANAQSQSTLKWETVRGFIPYTADFGNVTLVAMSALASNQLNNNSASRYNCYAQRLIPIWNPDTLWVDNQTTRNPVWAFCDVFRASYGGRLSETFLDLLSLYELAQYYEDNEIYFDYVFDQRSTVWEAAKVIARSGRAVPMLVGSQLSMIRDRAQDIATAIFNQNNIIAGSFQWSIKLPTVAENDGLEIEYMDENTWTAETVVCLLDDDDGLNNQKVKLPGVTDRTRAFQEGLYQRACQRYQVESIEFKTGLEGHLPLFGDLILVSHDVPQWGTAGRVMAITTVEDVSTLTLSEPVVFKFDTTHKVILRKKDGSAFGPFTTTAGDDSLHILVSPAIVEEFYFDDSHEPPFFLFGEENLETKRCLVVGIEPDGDDVVTIKATAYDERIYSFDSVETPDRYAIPTSVVLPGLPDTGDIVASQVAGAPDYLQLYWPPSLGAKYYTVETSPDNSSWTLAASPLYSNALLKVTGDIIYIRVAAYNTGRGAYSLWSGHINLDAIPADVENLILSSSAAGTVTIAWDVVPLADTYTVIVIDALTRHTLRTEVGIAGLTYDYDSATAATDGITSAEVLFHVKSNNAFGTSANPAVLLVTIPDTDTEPPIIPISLTCDYTHVFCDTTHAKADHT